MNEKSIALCSRIIDSEDNKRGHGKAHLKYNRQQEHKVHEVHHSDQGDNSNSSAAISTAHASSHLQP